MGDVDFFGRRAIEQTGNVSDGESQNLEVIDLDELGPSVFESDPCYRVLVEHLPKLPDGPRPKTGIPLLDLPVDPFVRAMGEAWARVELAHKLEWMREFVTIKSKGQRGRPKGSVKEHTEDAFGLWKQGYTEGEIRRHFKVHLHVEFSDQEFRKLMARIRSKKQRLPEEERKAVQLAHWEGRGKRMRWTPLFGQNFAVS